MGIFGSTSREELEQYPPGLDDLLRNYKKLQTTNDERFGGKITLYSLLSDPNQMVAVHSSWSLSPEEETEKNNRIGTPEHLEKTRLVHSRTMTEHPGVAK